MYMHQQMWPAALHVAEAHDAGAVASVYRAHGAVLAADGKLPEAEAVYLQGKAPDPAIKMYRHGAVRPQPACSRARAYTLVRVPPIESPRNVPRSWPCSPPPPPPGFVRLGHRGVPIILSGQIIIICAAGTQRWGPMRLSAVDLCEP